MNLVYLLPVVLLIALALIVFYWRRGKGGSGLGDRDDSRERPELRGDAQWRSRP